MNAIKATCCAALIAALTINTASAAKFGYSTLGVERDMAFRVGTSGIQGQAIRLDSEKLAMLAGRKITGLSAVLGSRQTTNKELHIFLTTSPEAAPIAEKTVTISSPVKWLDFSFDTPYSITGEEGELYLGFTGEISTQATLLMADHTADMKERCYVLNEGRWVDSYGMGMGNAMIAAIVDGDSPVTDLMIKPIAVDRYFKAGAEHPLKAQVFNFGTEGIKSISLKTAVGSQNASETTIEGIDIAPCTVYDIELPPACSQSDGRANLSIEVLPAGADGSPADNIFSDNIYFYPAAMERAILLEGFTGQDCHNCPDGHKAIASFLEAVGHENVIEVMHHSGYQPDQFTMDSDVDYTYFFGGSSTFAPGVMVNRTQVPGVAAVPVANCSFDNMMKSYNFVEQSQPYVSLSLKTSVNNATKELTIRVDILAHTDLPEGTNILNVMLVQDGLTARQVPFGPGYTHDAVFRGCLTGNSWGLSLSAASCKAGAVTSWEHTMILPEAVFSDYYKNAGLTDEQKLVFTWQIVPENTRIVAYVAAYGSDPNSHRVFNAVDTTLGESHVQQGFAGVADVQTDGCLAPEFKCIGGRIVVEGDCDSIEVYTLDGRKVSADVQLGRGVYVVRATNGAQARVKKILVK